MARIKVEELQNYLWNAAVLLRTHVDAGSYKQYIFPLLFYKRMCDVYDEEYDKALERSKGDREYASFPENHSFVIPSGFHWNDLRETSVDIGKKIIDSFKAIEKANPDKLAGIFGDAAWTNKKRLPDKLLKDIVEHFSSKELTLENCPEDEMGVAYEYLIKKFADDSGHTAQEFYTNRTVVHLMTEMLQPMPGESVYDPTCGSAGMPISCVTYLKNKGLESRNVSIYGQEINALTASIGRMNLFLHGVKDFHIANADTLSNPAFIKFGKLQTFSVVLANPPYSIKQWDREAFSSDRYGRNFLGLPPQGRADYAFFQHILKSLDPEVGRCAILFPHGVLFRKEEKNMRANLIRSDLLECVIGIAPNLFYNSNMDACIVICRTKKSASRKGRVLFIDARELVDHDGTFTFLNDAQISTISEAYRSETPIPSFSHFATAKDIEKNDYSLNIPLYVDRPLKAGESRASVTLVDSLAGYAEATAEADQILESVIAAVKEIH